MRCKHVSNFKTREMYINENLIKFDTLRWGSPKFRRVRPGLGGDTWPTKYQEVQIDEEAHPKTSFNFWEKSCEGRAYTFLAVGGRKVKINERYILLFGAKYIALPGTKNNNPYVLTLKYDNSRSSISGKRLIVSKWRFIILLSENSEGKILPKKTKFLSVTYK